MKRYVMRNLVNFDCGDDKPRLEAAAEREGKTVSMLARHAVRVMLEHLERGGKLERYSIPLDVEERLRAIERAVAGAKGPREDLVAAISDARSAIERLAELLKLDV